MICVWCECVSEVCIGVEMEVLVGVNVVLLILYDLSKLVELVLCIEGICLLFKEGGKCGVWLYFDGMDDVECVCFKLCVLKGLEGVVCVVIMLSDCVSEGIYEDVFGLILVIGLKKLGGEVVVVEVLFDGIELLVGCL